MTRTTVVANRRLYTVSGLEPRPRGSIVQAVVAAQLVDGLTGAPVEGARVGTTFPGLRSRTASSGFVGLVGNPSRALPGLATTTYDVDLVVDAAGYAPRHERASFATQGGFPAGFTPADLGVLRMRRAPVVVRVGSYELDSANRPVPLPGAAVSLTGHWTTVDLIGSPPASTPLLAVGPGLGTPRPAGSTVDLPPLSQPAEPPRTLAVAAAAGATRIAVSNAGALGPGDLVGLDLGDPDRAERIEVVTVDGAADASSPAVLVLRFPLAVAHADGTPAARIVAPGAAPPLAVLTAEALAGDRTLFVSTLAGVAPGQVLRISGGSAAPEYRTADLYDITTNGEGAGRFPPTTGVAAIAVSAVSGGLGAAARLTLTQSSPAVDLTLV